MALLINEIDNHITRFHKRFPAEKHVRSIASRCKNSYNIAIFACCQEKQRKEYYSFPANARQEDEADATPNTVLRSPIKAFLKKRIAKAKKEMQPESSEDEETAFISPTKGSYVADTD